MGCKKTDFISIQENEYTGLQAYKAPMKAFRVYVKDHYASSVQIDENTFYANKTAYMGSRIAIAVGILTFITGLTLAIVFKAPESIMLAIFGPIFTAGPIAGISQDSTYGSQSVACPTLEDALSQAIAYQEKATEEVKASLEYNEYLKNLSEASNSKLLGTRD